MRLVQLNVLRKKVKSFYLLQDHQQLTYSDTIQADIPSLLQNPLWFVRGNSDHEKKKEKRERNETIQYFEMFFNHGWLIPNALIC